MPAEILEVEEDIALVEVVDARNNLHRVEVKTGEDGSIGLHAHDAYPLDPAERTDEQERIMSQVNARARFEVHSETEYDILTAGWQPQELERGIEALEKLSLDRFDTLFSEYYEALLNPERVKEQLDITAGSVEFPGEPRIVLLMKNFCIDGNDEIVTSQPLYIFYSHADIDKNYTAGPDLECPDGTTKIPPMLPPFRDLSDEFAYPEDFRDTMINNLVCQIRDIYRNMGEAVPDGVDIDGFGKPRGNFDTDEYKS